MSDLNKKVVSATKWSGITEIAAKLVSPISTMVLARLLTPDAFGVLVTAVMVISFAEIFTDAGFQKYLIQHKFRSSEELYQSTTVAFWSNFILSTLIWIGIIVFAEEIAILVGNKGHGDVIAISCICIPLAAFSSIQMALYKRDLNFKTLFLVRIVGIFIPLIITIPLAYYTRSYWSLIIGMIALNLSNAIILTVKSKWKPNFFFSFPLLKEMFSFTFWSMIEAISIWLTGYVDIFIVGTMLNQHYLGIYRTSMSTVGQIMGLITAATTPVLFSSLSKLQDDDQALKKMFFSFQKLVGIIVIPMGVSIFLFQDLITSILLGSQWHEAAHFIGLWGLTSAITIVLSHYCSEIFRAKGYPKLSVLSQTLYLIIFIPDLYFFAHKGFNELYIARSLVRFVGIIISLSILFFAIKISPIKMIINIMPSIISSSFMAIIATICTTINTSIIWAICSILICIICYCAAIGLFPVERHILKDLINRYMHNISKQKAINNSNF